MGRGSKVGFKQSTRRRVQPKERGSDESDEEYKVGEDDEFDESDDYCSLEGDETEELLAAFGEDDDEEMKVKRVVRSNAARKGVGQRKASRSKKSQKNRRVLKKVEEDDEEEEEEEDYEDDEFDESDDYCSLDGDETEELLADFGEDEEDYDEEKKVKRVVRSNAARKGVGQRKAGRSKKSQKNRRVLKKVEEDDDDDDEEDYEDEGDDDEEFMLDESSLQRMVNRIKKPRKKRKASQKVEEDEEFMPDESFLQRKVNQIKKPQKKRRVLHKVEEDDDDEDEEEEEAEAEDDEEFVSDDSFLQRKANQIKTPREWRVSKKVEEDEEADYEDEGEGEGEDEEDDEDDEEFMLNSDFVDDEDEMLVMEKNKKVNRPPLKKGFVKGQKRRRSKVLRKPSRQKPRTNRRLTRKRRCVANGEATNTNRVVDENSRKISVRRTRRQMVESDSDFVNSVPSDFEYTISEEEREQVREASKFCTNLETNVRSSASRKKLQEDEKSMCQQRRRTRRKGKEKVEEMKNVVKQVCGICLSEEGKKTVRGSLNCCSHYFCFACIMEWSKVESRCPLCKQRFMTISKPAKSNTGFDLRTMVIQVPERDQVYQPSEEELQGYLDPYENVICTECQQGGDDALMLLCDICDSPAHTFCVGLQREVPEGNWYCDGCRPAAFASLNPQGLSPMGGRRASNMFGPVSPFPGGIDLNALYVPESPLTQETGIFPSFRRQIADHLVASPASGLVAYTVSDRRRIHRQIHDFMRGQSNFGSAEIAPSSGIRLFGSRLDQGRASTSQRTINQESAAPLYTTNGRRLEDNTSPLGHNRDLFSARAGQFRGQIQDRASTSVAGSFLAEHGGFDVAFTPRLVHEQLHPSTSRSSDGADATTSPYACREVIVPSRTSQGGLHTPF